MSKRKNKLRIYGTNTLGITMLILAPIIGPLVPGPGGIPLLLGGLKLLSINNPWAHKFYEYFADKGSSLADIIFVENKKIQLLWDIGIIIGLITSISMFFIFDLHFILSIINSAVITYLVLAALRNRHRWKKILKIIKKTNDKRSSN